MNRHKAREKAFQTLFQLDMNEDEVSLAMESLKEEERKDVFLSMLIEGVITYKEAIDLKISENLEKWSLERVASVERTILRLAVYELLYMEDIPQNVTINEAVELAHTFGDEQSGKFINGVLSKVIS
ncbi:N utilization substance protein B [Oceanobacillus oncorhynchi subsp. incaldanensis]|uniref:transcription antitermination factor NusB n=1 Tax=Oceanobacillus TaxID=182709 RepID=UPI00186922E2|nr:transcription antitermination factor NusB [Oceanobacillus oncorhynchi]GIO20980.1 N utilization substance protein B [Oceanobacillus oncorhynchi subsp. incaldanensis]